MCYNRFNYKSIADKTIDGMLEEGMAVIAIRGKAKDGGFITDEGGHITRRELLILAQVGNGIVVEAIARKFKISEQTVRNHITNVVKKIGANDRAHAIAVAMQKGMLKLAWESKRDSKEFGLYVWCVHCERTYMHGEFRMVIEDPIEINHVMHSMNYEGCPYEDCDGSAVIDAIEWDYVREHRPDYPEVPVRGVVYSQ